MSEVVHTSLKTAVKGTTLVLAGMVLSILLWFAIKILLIRNITVDEFGVYTLAVTIVSILSSISTLGTHEGITRFVSTFLGEGRRKDVESITNSSLHINIIVSLFAFVFLYAFSDIAALHIFYKPEIAAPLKVISFSIPFAVMTGNISGILRGYGVLRPKVYYQDIGRPFFFLVILSGVFLFGVSVIGIIYAFVISAVIMLIAIASYGFKKLGLNVLPLRRGGHYRALINLSMPLLFGGIAAMILSWTDTLMLGRYTASEDVGIYNVSISLARLMNFPLGALGFVFLPLAGELYAKKFSQELKRTYQVLTKWIFSATLPLFFVLFIFPEMTITFLFGEHLVESAQPLRILALGFLFHAFTGAMGPILTAMGKTKVIMNTSVFVAVINVVLNYVLIKRLGYGVVGASVATLVSYSLMNIITAAILYKYSGIHPFTHNYLKPVLSSAVIGLFIYAAAKTLPFSFWLLPLYLFLFICAYAFSLLVTKSLEHEDIVLFEAISSRIGLRLDFIRKVIYRYIHD